MNYFYTICTIGSATVIFLSVLIGIFWSKIHYRMDTINYQLKVLHKAFDDNNNEYLELNNSRLEDYKNDWREMYSRITILKASLSLLSDRVKELEIQQSDMSKDIRAINGDLTI